MGWARVFVNKDIGTLMDIYYHNVRSLWKLGLFSQQEMCCQIYQKKITKLPIFSTLKLQQLLYIERWFQQKQKQNADAVCSQISHSRATYEKFYQYISTEQSFSVQLTIKYETVCFFSQIIKLEWPLSNHHSIPLRNIRDCMQKQIIKYKITGKTLDLCLSNIYYLNICVNQQQLITPIFV